MTAGELGIVLVTPRRRRCGGYRPNGIRLTQMSALELAAAIRSERVPGEDVIEAHLRRIEAVNPSINAVTVVLGKPQ